MVFKEGLSQFRFLSELYKADEPAAVLLTEYPSSNSDETQFRNTEEFIIHDPFPPPERALLKILGPHHLMFCWGNNIPVCSEISPHEELFSHWRRSFGDDCVPKWKGYDAEDKYITLFPYESLSDSQNVIDQKTLYDLHSKAELEKIDCVQAKVLSQISAPCILKLSHGYAGLGNFFINDEQDEIEAKNYIDQHWPGAKIVINEIIEDIIGDFGVQFYLAKDGSFVCMGFTNQLFNENKRWVGGRFSLGIQDELYSKFMPIVKSVAKHLSQNGYFGVVGVDILQNKNDEFFLVDINPRLTGITPFLIASRLLIHRGYEEGLYAASILFKGDLKALIRKAESIEKSKVFVLSAYEDKQSNITKCHLSIHSESQEECSNILNSFR